MSDKSDPGCPQEGDHPQKYDYEECECNCTAYKDCKETNSKHKFWVDGFPDGYSADPNVNELPIGDKCKCGCPDSDYNPRNANRKNAKTCPGGTRWN